ncbi:hypothetical protein SELMODRAFT_416844 [Selaginella moellendorffii]|uniref:Cytochrome c-type biogenesis protein H TPR domain-containing protein n=1 Tax=Selaginella moellendorffii TaxID=88036 RepID=D8S0K8_SELML|nr:hypothetical protein SELMODRAFT_416844 [Selaginella moellendorffii]
MGRSDARKGARRGLLLGASIFFTGLCAVERRTALAWFPAKIDAARAPQHPFDAADQRLRNAAMTFEQALRSSTVEEEERLWTKVIDSCEGVDAEWVPDILSRAYGNRGNSRSRQAFFSNILESSPGKIQEALEDYDRSILLAPYAVDPVLNRGVALESLRMFEKATADYVAVLQSQPDDPAAWNNLGNVQGALGRWSEALKCYGKATKLSPQYAFAAGNYALALYQTGRENEAIRQFRSLLRKYPEFPDIRAALAVSLYAQGSRAEAETNWSRLEDGRYKDRSWIRNTRRWPPKLADALDAFLEIRVPV